MEVRNFTRCAYLCPGEGNPRNSEGAFLRLRDGRILFAYSRYIGTDAGDDAECEIAGIYSYDNGETWDTEHIRTLVRASEYSEKNVMSVSLERMDNGDAGLFYLVKHDANHNSSYVLRRSMDEFESFSEEVRILPERFSAYYVVNNDRICHAGENVWVVPAAKQAETPGMYNYASVYESLFVVSYDDGHTWKQLGPILFLSEASYSATGLQEPGICVLPGNVWYAYFRTDRMWQYESVSLDQGEHWFSPQPSKFTSAMSPMLIKQNPCSGKYYAVWNPVPDYPGRPHPGHSWTAGRNPLVIADSADGVRFSEMYTLENDETRGFCYPALYFLDEKTALISYCSGGDTDGCCCLNRTTIGKIEF